MIGDGPPEGICGSGLVDLLSELLRTGRMNDMGRFEDGVRANRARRRRTSIFFLESDVNELAQAKGANVAGLQIVFEQLRHRTSTTSTCFYLAGGFGRHLKIDAVQAHRADSEPARLENRAGRQCRD